jgi:hypothetical protein
MGVGHLTYLDLSPEQRQQAAGRARERLRSHLANPFMTADQAKLLQEQAEKIDRWEAGLLPVETPRQPSPLLADLKALPGPSIDLPMLEAPKDEPAPEESQEEPPVEAPKKKRRR